MWLFYDGERYESSLIQSLVSTICGDFKMSITLCFPVLMQLFVYSFFKSEKTGTNGLTITGKEL